eukprot:Pompholyxophrys_punicea_v1_NODE_1420_length_727_cov_6.983631.p1 type:complete len:146 gc:universal NODE_1420_length_727_cov_6.983631:2-439(+)
MEDGSRSRNLYYFSIAPSFGLLFDDEETSNMAHYDALSPKAKSLIDWVNLTLHHAHEERAVALSLPAEIPSNSPIPAYVTNLSSHWRSGVRLLELIEALTMCQIDGEVYKQPSILFHCFHNASLALRLLAAHTFAEVFMCTPPSI